MGPTADNDADTKQVSFYQLRRSNGKQSWLIDTPGFDDTERENIDLLKELIACLTVVDQRGGRITGIFYLHRIIDPRMGGSSMKSLTLFKLLVGAAAMPLVRLVSTRWNDLGANESDLERGNTLEKQLCTSQKYWGSCLSEGALAMRHYGDQASAQAVVESVLNRDATSTARLSIIQELRDKKLPLLETGVGRFLSEDTDRLARQYEADIANLKHEQHVALEEKDHELAQQLAAEEHEFRRRSEKVAWVRKELSNEYMPPQRQLPQRSTPNESIQRGKVTKAPAPPLPHRVPGQPGATIENLGRRQMYEQRVMEHQLTHERKKNHRERHRSSQGSNRFFYFLMNGYVPC